MQTSQLTTTSLPSHKHLRVSVDAVSEGICGIDANGVITFVNPAAARMLGYRAAELVGEKLHQLIHPAKNGQPLSVADCPICQAAQDGSEHLDLQGEFTRKDGSIFPVRYNVAPIVRRGQRTGTIVTFRDDTRRLRGQLCRERLQTIIDETPAFISTSDREGNITYINKTGRRWLGLAEDAPINGWVLTSDSRKLMELARESGVWQGERDDFLQQWLDGKQSRSVLQTVVAHKGATGEIDFYSTIAIDMTERKRLEKEKARLLAIVEDTPDFVSTCDVEGRFLYLNRAARTLLDVKDDADVAKLTIADIHPESVAHFIVDEALPKAAKAGVWQGDTVFVSRDGRQIPMLQVIIAHKDEAGKVEYYSSIARDITDRKRTEEWLTYLATHDPLTGVMNRARFQQELENAVANARQNGSSGALLYLDLDNFKDVNDSLGHQAGDDILQRIANIFSDNVREKDKIARLGGDEFAILLPDTTPQEAQAIANRLLKKLEEEVVLLGDRTVRMQASVGLATFPEHADNVEDLLIHADLSMYAAKRQGGHRIVVCTTGEKARAKAQSRLDWQTRCLEALHNDGFTLLWQPLLDLRTGEVAAYELLLRMKGDDGHLIAPGEFLPFCERSDLIHRIDRWVLSQAVDYLAHRPAGSKPYRLHVNLSRRTLAGADWSTFVRGQLDTSGIDASKLVIELTETATLENVRQAVHMMQQLQTAGLRFALDDFGVGFSSLSALRQLPVDYLKIDGSFIRNLPEDAVNRHLVKAFVEIAKGLGKKTVAEFVEDEKTLHLLKKYGVDYAQGYYIGRPQLEPVKPV